MSTIPILFRDQLEEIRILHVDDEPGFADMTATFMQRENERFTIETETNASDGLDRLTDEQFDCVVSDYDMPSQNGIDFLKAVRESHPKLPFILFTGKGSEEIASDAISTGVTDYLQKGTGTSQYTVLANRITNVVEQFHSQKVITETEQKLSQIAEHTDDILFMFNGDWTELLFVNSVYEEIWGGTTDELRDNPQSFLEYIHPDDRDKTIEAMEQVSSGKSNDIEYRVQHSDGEQRWIHGKTKPIVDAEGDVSRIVGFVRDITDRKSREQELETVQRQFEAVLENTTTPMFMKDNEGKYLFVNRAYRDLFGLRNEEIVGRTDHEVHPPEMATEVQKNDHAVIERGDPIETEERIVIGGDERTFLSTKVPIYDTGNRSDPDTPVATFGVATDITDRKDAEQQLREEQQFVQSIFQSLPDPLYTFDTDGDPIRWNEQFENVTGYSSTEIEEMHVTEFVPDDETNKIATNFQTILDEKRSVTIESAFETNDGTHIPYEFTGGPLEATDGTVSGVTGIGRDITDRTAREQQLEALNRVTQELMSAETQNEVVEIGIETTRDLLGIEANSIHLYDEDAKELVPVASTDAVYDLVSEPPTFTDGDSIAWRVYQRGETLAIDDVHEDPDRYNPDTPIRSELHLPLGEYGILLAGSPSPETFDEQDVLLGEILAGGLATALEQIERTDQLRARERELTKQNDRLEEFASVVSHDLRNPLTVAQGRLDLAAAECDSEHLEHVGQAHERMRTLIDDLLTLAREGEAVTDLEPVALASLVEECWAIVETDEATLVTNVDRTVQADKSRLKQLFENLIRNAVEHGGENVTVTLGELDDGYYVEDDGPGIPADEREHIFEVGYSTSGDGTGFGLSIVKQIVEAHDWQIRATEGAAGGVRFEIIGVETAAE